jgi:hypothetical protein
VSEMSKKRNIQRQETDILREHAILPCGCRPVQEQSRGRNVGGRCWLSKRQGISGPAVVPTAVGCMEWIPTLLLILYECATGPTWLLWNWVLVTICDRIAFERELGNASGRVNCQGHSETVDHRQSHPVLKPQVWTEGDLNLSVHFGRRARFLLKPQAALEPQS